MMVPEQPTTPSNSSEESEPASESSPASEDDEPEDPVAVAAEAAQQSLLALSDAICKEHEDPVAAAEAHERHSEATHALAAAVRQRDLARAESDKRSTAPPPPSPPSPPPPASSQPGDEPVVSLFPAWCAPVELSEKETRKARKLRRQLLRGGERNPFLSESDESGSYVWSDVLSGDSDYM